MHRYFCLACEDFEFGPLFKILCPGVSYRKKETEVLYGAKGPSFNGLD